MDIHRDHYDVHDFFLDCIKSCRLQVLPLKHLKARAPARRDMAQLLSDAELLRRRRRVATADDARRARFGRDGAGAVLQARF